MTIKKSRFAVFGIITAIFVILLLWKFFSVMILSKTDETSWGISSDVERGSIWDRNGEVLAMQDQLTSVAAWRPDLGNREKTAILLSSILDKSSVEIAGTLKGDSGFVYLQRKLGSGKAEKIKEMIDSGEITGILLQPEYGRNYPNKNLASHILGYVGLDNYGLAGIEYAYDEYLSPVPKSGDTGTAYGNHLYLTIDMNIQYMSEKTARKTFDEQDADSVMVLAMDAKTGDFLSIASYPDFDPNSWEEASEDQLAARPFTYAYEPGSVFKVFSVSSFLESGAINENDYFFCNGHYVKEYDSGRIDTIDCLGSHGYVNAEKIIIQSCNAGAAYASDMISNEAFHGMLVKFGFGSKTTLPFPGESNGSLKPVSGWSGRSKPTIAFGQEILVSAVQVVTAATVITNGGQLLEPHIVRKIVTPEQKLLLQNTRKPVSQVMSAANAERMLSYMKKAAQAGGTARRAAIEGISVAAKTGTAEAIDPETGGYSESKYVASCLGIFPAEDPRVILYIVIDYPKKDSNYGGVIAAPLISELGSEIADYLGIPRDDQLVLNHPGKVVINPLSELQIGDTMPELYGLSKKELSVLFSDERFEVEIRGEGWVIGQYPPPGTAITGKTHLILELQ